MSSFGLNKNYSQFDFEEITVDDLSLISGGSGGTNGWRCAMGIGGGALAAGAGTAAAIGPGNFTPAGWVIVGVSAVGGGL